MADVQMKRALPCSEVNPAVGAEFDRANQGVGDEKDKEQNGANGELADHSSGGHQQPTNDPPDHLTIAGAFEDVGKEFGEQVAGDQGAQDPNGLEHFGEAGALFGGFGFGELLAHEHDTVDDGGHEVESELDFPADLHPVIQVPANDGPQHHACGPGGVQDVEVVSALFGVKGGDQRVGHGFQGAVRVSEDEHAPEQEVIGVLRRAGHEGDHSGEDVAEQGKANQFAVADFIDDQAAEDDAEAESGETGTANGSELSPSEAVLAGPVVKDASANREADPGCEDGHEAGP
jgi:hypothetical protein